MNLDEIKSLTQEELTDEEAVDLLRKMEKSKQANKENKPYLTFHWGKAIMLIHAHNIKNAAFGLQGDWEESSAIGLQNGVPTKPLEMSKFGYGLTSNWGVPQLYDMDKDQFYDCYRVVPENQILQYTQNVEPWWPEEAVLSFGFVNEIMEDLS